MAEQRGFDAGREHLGAVYAQALLGASEKAGVTDQVMVELDSLVVDVLEKLPSFKQVLAAPKISFEDKGRMIDRALSGKASTVLIHALKVMARHGRLDLIADVRKAYRRLYNELRGRVEVHVRSATELTPAMRDQIAARLQALLGKEVDLEVQVEPSLLGGIVVRVGDTLLDGSLKTKLNQMRDKALARTERELRTSLERFVAA